MQDKLEEIKKLGNYGLMVFFGEDIGCDDLDVKLEDRALKVSYFPVGYLGGLRVLWVGTVGTFALFDFLSEKPKQVNNPPSSNVTSKNGFYVWGTDDNVQNYLSK